MFLEYVRSLLGPTLRAGDIVIADNPGSHKVAGVKEAIEAQGASILYLPPYSPEECRNYFASAGYVHK